jgi:hypothetical protein
MKKVNEYRNFTRLTDTILSVPHSELKAKLDAEKQAKNRKKAKKVKRNDD